MVHLSVYILPSSFYYLDWVGTLSTWTYWFTTDDKSEDVYLPALEVGRY
jgi:hypothetical protein